MRFATLFLLLTSFLACNGSGCTNAKRALVGLFTPTYEPELNPAGFVPQFEGTDAKRKRVDVTLATVVEGLNEVTDIQFPPGRRDVMVILEKGGRAVRIDIKEKSLRPWFQLAVATDSEEGLLGLAFHPKFADNRLFYLNYVVSKNGQDTSRVAEWEADREFTSAKEKRTIFELAQPYPNHNAGQLAFGPDGYLYIGWGDGGWRDDPHGNGQNTQTYLGSMLRVDVDRPAGGKPYGIPEDNPFLGKPGYLPEMWAYGFRNPWRYSFDNAGRLIVADVGQNTWEEIDLVVRGGNYGWNVREGRHCFAPKEGCKTQGLHDPFYEYGHDEGSSITGGYVYEGEAVPELRGKYVFGDFLSGRIWAVDVPQPDFTGTVTATTLGKWPILPSTFGRDPDGELYVANFAPGVVYKIVPVQGR